MKKSTLATILFLITTVFFGGAYVFIREGVSLINPYSFIFYRFLIASLIVFIFFHKSIIKLSKQTIKYGILIGIPFTLAVISLAIGLQTTTASKAGFIGGLYIIFVPLILTIIQKKLPLWNQTLAVIISIFGLSIITLEANFKIALGDIWVIIFSFFLAVQIILVGKLAKKQNAINLTFVQFFFVFLITGIFLVFTGSHEFPKGYLVWQALIFVAVFTTILAYFVQNRYQRYISDIKVGLIYSLEPVFAALIAFFYLKESLTLRVFVGGSLIFIALILSEIKKDLNVKQKKGGLHE